jgi:hypothetical protein
MDGELQVSKPQTSPKPTSLPVMSDPSGSDRNLFSWLCKGSQPSPHVYKGSKLWLCNTHRLNPTYPPKTTQKTDESHIYTKHNLKMASNLRSSDTQKPDTAAEERVLGDKATGGIDNDADHVPNVARGLKA